MLFRPLPFLVLGVGVVVVSFAAILIRLAQAEGASSLAIAAVRLTVAAAVLTPFVWLRAGREIMRLGCRPFALCMLSGALLAAHFWAWITSLEHTSVASSTALVTTNPLWVALVSAFILREPLGAIGIAGMVLTLAGSMLVFAADASRASVAGAAPNLGNALALLGAIAASGYLLIGRAMRFRISLPAYIWLAYTAAAALLAGAALASGEALVSLTWSAWLSMVALGLGPQLIGHTSFNWALRRLTATFVAIAILGEPIGAAILAWFFFGEGFGQAQAIGFVLLLSGIFLAARGEKFRAVQS
jgi:drug/metabolite transporter (DMT)-like permease